MCYSSMERGLYFVIKLIGALALLFWVRIYVFIEIRVGIWISLYLSYNFFFTF